MRFSLSGALLLSLAHLGRSQEEGGLSLGNAIANYTELSQFASLLANSPGVLSTLVPQGFTGITVLIPSNKALDKFLQQTGQSVTALPANSLRTMLQYHILAAKMTSSNFTAAKRGLTIPTLLRDQLYNNRSAGPELVQTFGAAAAEGNVLFVSPDPISPAKLRVRQQGSTANARGGLGGTSTISAVDGAFQLGFFQIVDTVLAPPSPCSATIRTLSSSLNGLDNALNRSGLYPVLDASPNVTCLAPNNAAFKAAGDPDQNLNETALGDALLFHTLPLVTYSNFLTDGLVIKSAAGLDVTVRLVDADIYFNDAKVLSPNVLTNNGLIHVLDRVMSANGTAPAPGGSGAGGSGGGSTTTTGSGGATPTPTSTKPNAGAKVGAGSGAVAGLVVLVAGALLAL